jgi:hypothetical protein
VCCRGASVAALHALRAGHARQVAWLKRMCMMEWPETWWPGVHVTRVYPLGQGACCRVGARLVRSGGKARRHTRASRHAAHTLLGGVSLHRGGVCEALILREQGHSSPLSAPRHLQAQPGPPAWMRLARLFAPREGPVASFLLRHSGKRRTMGTHIVCTWVKPVCTRGRVRQHAPAWRGARGQH